jgi:hypothetical protein
MLLRLCLVVGIGNVVAAWEVEERVLLREKRFLLAHDSATGYVGNDVERNQIKAQETNFVGQLNCGARALDLRLGFQNSGGPLKFHHGPFYMQDQTVENTMPGEGPNSRKSPGRPPPSLLILFTKQLYNGLASIPLS